MKMLRLSRYGEKLVLYVGHTFRGNKRSGTSWSPAAVSDIVDLEKLRIASYPLESVSPGLTGRYRYHLCEEMLVLQVEEFTPWRQKAHITFYGLPMPDPPPAQSHKDYQWRDAKIEDLTVGSVSELKEMISV